MCVYINYNRTTFLALPCTKITNLLNGKMTCTGHVTYDVCKATCDDGYKLIGSMERTCSPNSVWSGDEQSCKGIILFEL